MVSLMMNYLSSGIVIIEYLILKLILSLQMPSSKYIHRNTIIH